MLLGEGPQPVALELDTQNKPEILSPKVRHVLTEFGACFRSNTWVCRREVLVDPMAGSQAH